MLNKIKILLLLIIFSSNLYSHKEFQIDLEIKDLKNNTFSVLVRSKKNKMILKDYNIQLISKLDKRILNEKKSLNKILIFDIPNESYWIYLNIRDDNIIKNGIIALNGFKINVDKEKKAFKYTLILSLLFIFMSALIYINKLIFKHNI